MKTFLYRRLVDTVPIPALVVEPEQSKPRVRRKPQKGDLVPPAAERARPDQRFESGPQKAR
jgi:hypothetical protein